MGHPTPAAEASATVLFAIFRWQTWIRLKAWVFEGKLAKRDAKNTTNTYSWGSNFYGPLCCRRWLSPLGTLPTAILSLPGSSQLTVYARTPFMGVYRKPANIKSRNSGGEVSSYAKHASSCASRTETMEGLGKARRLVYLRRVSSHQEHIRFQPGLTSNVRQML